VLVCGGMGGVMLHACRGAKSAGGVTIGILPTSDRSSANPYVDYSIPTALGEARNSIVVRSSDAIIAIGGSFGTLSEIAFALKFQKPLVGVSTWKLIDWKGDAPSIQYMDEPEKAVMLALKAIGKEV
ncbi:MAG: LOG family protein, partial [Candidatus Omnitrophica bacterium]|nr:LOG family protein [Candidatus Omnitrophota bacterium]